MTEVRPIQNTRQYVELLHDAADRTGVRSPEVPARVEDPSLVETKRAQRESVGDSTRSFVENGVRELVSSSASALGFVVGALGPFSTLRELSLRLIEAHDQGDALAKARARDAMHLAILNLGSGALPEGFVQLNAHLLRESYQGASRILTHLIGSGQYAELKASTEAFVKRGVDLAAKYGIVDAASLALARQNPAFEADYRNNPAVRLGVDATIYLHHQSQVSKQ